MVDEILVHISTPATNQNDTLYRSLAAEYLKFEPDTKKGKLPAPTNADVSIASTSKDSYGSFPSHISFNLEYDARPQGEPQDAFEPTSSRLAKLDRIHHHWIEQITPKTGSTGQRRFETRPDDVQEADTACIEDTQLGIAALQSQLLEEFSTTDEDTEDEESDRVYQQKAALSSQNRDTTDEAHTNIALPPVPATPFAASEDTNIDNWQPLTLEPDASITNLDQPNLNNDQDVEASHGTPDFIDFTRLPLDAFPPAPKVSIDRPGILPTQITQHLKVVKAQNPKRFKPSKRRGEVKHDDRGYWLVECGTWPDRVQFDFWSSLSEHILSGRLGWGVTLHRDARSLSKLGSVRVYCWGEVVEHIWLMLWLCSGGKVARSGARWVDANGIAAFEVM